MAICPGGAAAAAGATWRGRTGYRKILPATQPWGGGGGGAAGVASALRQPLPGCHLPIAARQGGLKSSAPLPPCHEGELFEQHQVLLILEQGAVKRRERLADVAVLEHHQRTVLGVQQLQPTDHLTCRRLLLEPPDRKSRVQGKEVS